MLKPTTQPLRVGARSEKTSGGSFGVQVKHSANHRCMHCRGGRSRGGRSRGGRSRGGRSRGGNDGGNGGGCGYKNRALLLPHHGPHVHLIDTRPACAWTFLFFLRNGCTLSKTASQSLRGKSQPIDPASSTIQPAAHHRWRKVRGSLHGRDDLLQLGVACLAAFTTRLMRGFYPLVVPAPPPPQRKPCPVV
jgi:hypothetical protein